MRNSNPTQKEAITALTEGFSQYPEEDQIVENWANEKNIQENLRKLILSISVGAYNTKRAIINSFQYMLFKSSEKSRFHFLMELRKALEETTFSFPIMSRNDILWEITEIFSTLDRSTYEEDQLNLEINVINEWIANTPVQESLSRIISIGLISYYEQGTNTFQYYIIESLKFILNRIPYETVALFIDEIKVALEAHEEIGFKTRATILWEATRE